VVTTASAFSAEEIERHLDLRNKTMQVIPHGLSALASLPSRPAGVPEGGGPFLFAIGHVVPRKNLAVLVPFLKRLPDISLVIAGRNTGSYARRMVSLAQEEGVANRIVMLGPVTADERQWLYQHCDAVVMPSLTEGFGLPVIEGMREGKPVFMSRATSLPEVGGPLGFYWDSYEPAHMAEVFTQGMQAVQQDRSYGDKLRAHAARFSWAAAAKAYIELYLDIGNRKLETAP
jgi:glycosyltransferase involved in cell wall biosynthesis